jgi:hypothetical protein
LKITGTNELGEPIDVFEIKGDADFLSNLMDIEKESQKPKKMVMFDIHAGPKSA